jgi:hypothetical protein
MAEKVRRTQERQLAVDEQSRVLDPSQLAAEMAEKVRRTQEQQRK